MSLKAELETWATALQCYDAQDFDTAIKTFDSIADSSKVLFNIGLIHATVGSHRSAVESFHQATSLDNYLAIAYFQCGVSNFLVGNYKDAVADFDEALVYLRGNMTIDYGQLGLKFRLYSCEALFNRGLALIYMGRADTGLNDLKEARREKQISEHDVIDEAIVDQGNGYTVFSIPVGVLFRPSMNKLNNVKSKNYLGQAKLVAATNTNDVQTGFSGADRMQISGNEMLNFKRPAELSRAVTTGTHTPSAENRDVFPNALRRRPTEATTTLSSTGQQTSLEKSLPQVAEPLGPPPPEKPEEAPRPLLERSRSQSDKKAPHRPTPLPLARANTTAGPPSESSYGKSPTGLSADKSSFSNGDFVDQYRPSVAETLEHTLSKTRTPSPLPPPTGQEDNSHSVSRNNLQLGAELSCSNSRLEPSRSASRLEVSRSNSRAEVSRNNSRAELSRSNSRAELSRSNSRSELSRSNSRPPIHRYGSVKRSNTIRNKRQEEEDGYGSAEYDEYLRSPEPLELQRIRVKLHKDGITRGMSITPEQQWDEFRKKILAKFSLRKMGLMYMDEDGTMVTMLDESDWESAIDASREFAQGRPEGKLEIWIT